MHVRETLEREALLSITKQLTDAALGSELGTKVASCGGLERALQRQRNLVKRGVEVELARLSSMLIPSEVLQGLQDNPDWMLRSHQRVVEWCLARAAMPRFRVTTSWTGNYDTVVRANSRSADILAAIERIAMGEVDGEDLDQDQPTQLRLVAV